MILEINKDGNRAYRQPTNGNLFCHITFQTSLGRSQTIISTYQKTSHDDFRESILVARNSFTPWNSEFQAMKLKVSPHETICFKA